MKKLSFILLIIVCLSSFSGCRKADEIPGITEDDPIAEYDSVEDVRVEGESGKFVVSKKLYVSDDCNVAALDFGVGWVRKGKLAVLKVENRIGKDCSVEIKATYVKKDGSEVRKESKQLSGFSKDDVNWFFFLPGVDFDDITYEIRTLDDNAPGTSGYWTFGTVATAYAPDFEGADEDFIRLAPFFSSLMSCSAPEKLYVRTEMLYFDNEGKPVGLGMRTGEDKGVLSGQAGDFCIEKDGKCFLPDNLTGELGCLVSIVKIYDQQGWMDLLSGRG